MILRPYQEAALEASAQAEAEGCRRQLIVLPTGGGKTVVFGSLLRRRGGRSLVLAHRDELLQQAKDKIQQVWPQARVGIVRGSLNESNADVVVASVQTLGREARRAKLRGPFQTIVIDEAHHIGAPSYGAILAHYGADDPLIVGVTATPYRDSGRSITRDAEGASGKEEFERCVFSMGIVDAIEQGFLCQIEGRLVHLKGLDLNAVRTKRGDLDTSQLEKMLASANWHEHLFQAYREHCSDRRTVLFIPPRVEMAYFLAEYFNSQGVNLVAVTGEQDAATRQVIYRKFAAGEIPALVNCEVLTEGWDEPSVDCVLMARPTKSKNVYVQAVGRGLRLYPGKRECLVVDVCGVTQRHDLMSLEAVIGARPLCGETVTQARERVEREKQEAAEKEAEIKRQLEVEHEARRIELIRQRDEREAFFAKQLAPVNPFNWQPTLEGTERLTVHAGGLRYTFHLRRLPDGLYTCKSVKPGTYGDLFFNTIKRSAEEARAAAEAQAQELLDQNKPAWTKQPASEKQISLLRKYRVALRPGITKGEASEILDRIFEAKRKREEAAV